MRFAPGVDHGGETYDVTQGTLLRLLSSPDRRLRQTAWESYIDRYVEFKNTLASSLSTSIRQFVLLSRVRGHPSSLAASLHENDIPLSVYHNLVEVFRSRLPIWHRYFALRRRLLGVDRLEHFDLWAPLTSNPVKITYPEAVEMICTGLAPMGEEYVASVRRGLPGGALGRRLPEPGQARRRVLLGVARARIRSSCSATTTPSSA